ncbi:MAG: hypothetical protein ACRD0H_17595, partial [Actinomycetes bacterium]
VAPGDSAALAVQLDLALADAAAGRGLSSIEALESSRRWADRWSMLRLARRYVEIYQGVLAEAAPAPIVGKPPSGWGGAGGSLPR